MENILIALFCVVDDFCKEFLPEWEKHPAALEAKKRDAQTQYNIKLNLTKQLYEKGWGKSEIINLYSFIDWVLRLPEAWELKYHDEVLQIEEEKKMAYISTAERIGIAKGIEQGKLQGQVEGESTMLLCLLKHRFQSIPLSYKKQIEAADPEMLLTWAQRLINAKTIDEVFASR